MRKVQIALYLVLIAYLVLGEDSPIGAYVYFYMARFWYGLAEYAGRNGINMENKYYEEVQ